MKKLALLSAAAFLLTTPAVTGPAIAQDGNVDQKAVPMRSDAPPLPPTPRKGPSESEIAFNTIMETGEIGPDLSPEQAADLSNCDGGSMEEVVAAIRTCQPVRDVYEAYALLLPLAMEMLDDRELLDNLGSGKATTVDFAPMLSAADSVIALAEDRTYPAEDAPLIIAHMMKMTYHLWRTDRAAMNAEFDTLVTISKTTRIDNNEFSNSSTFEEMRYQALQKLDKAQKGNK